MKKKGLHYGVLVLFAVLALSISGVYAEGQEHRMISGTGTPDNSRLSIADDLAVPDGCEEIAYDDGSAEGWATWINPGEWGPCYAVNFTRPDDCETLRTARFYIYLNTSVESNLFNWSVLEWTGTEPGSVIASGTTDPDKGGWYEVDMGDIAVPEDFVISMHWRHGYAPCLFVDTDSPADRSWDYPWSSEGYPWQPETKVNYMIRAIVIPDSEATVTIESANASEGFSKTVPISITDVTDLCGADIWLSYDRSVVIVDDVSRGEMGPISYNVSNDAGVTKMAWDSTEGVTGDFVLAYVTLTAVGSGGSVSPLNLEVNELYDSGFNDIGHNVVNGTFEVTIDLMEGDVYMDGCVSLKDSTMIKLYLVGRMDLNESQLKCADTLDDSEVNLKDSTFIRKWLVDPSTPLWGYPADDGMAKPETC